MLRELNRAVLYMSICAAFQSVAAAIEKEERRHRGGSHPRRSERN